MVVVAAAAQIKICFVSQLLYLIFIDPSSQINHVLPSHSPCPRQENVLSHTDVGFVSVGRVRRHIRWALWICRMGVVFFCVDWDRLLGILLGMGDQGWQLGTAGAARIGGLERLGRRGGAEENSFEK